MMNALCDNETGICAAPALSATAVADRKPKANAEVIYVGDPMCSWCWGIEPALRRIQDHCEERGMGFSIVLGGLRPGGGDPWNSGFKAFLRQHWAEIGEATGQPFSFGILDLEHFSYDTEPACRAVATARHMLGDAAHSRRLYAIFAAIQRKFYVDGADPTRLGFYEDIIEAAGLDFARFAQLLASDAAREWARSDFALNRSWGVRGFPTLLVKTGDRLVPVATGFISPEALIARVDAAIEA
ncbi:hypothetical protein GHV40_16080 [Devosia sp. D6-9]|nr:hypothetical protein GHV40_16080 [Devosia sp. D6-9]